MIRLLKKREQVTVAQRTPSTPSTPSTLSTLSRRDGAPIRLRVERQLGYKHAKYIMRLQLVDTFASIGGGKGGYWEDQGYEWYAGI